MNDGVNAYACRCAQHFCARTVSGSSLFQRSDIYRCCMNAVCDGRTPSRVSGCDVSFGPCPSVEACIAFLNPHPSASFISGSLIPSLSSLSVEASKPFFISGSLPSLSSSVEASPAFLHQWKPPQPVFISGSLPSLSSSVEASPAFLHQWKLPFQRSVKLISESGKREPAVPA